MERWHHIPGIFKKNIALSGAAAIGPLLITVTVFFTTGDRITLLLGLMLLLLGLLKTADFVYTVLTGNYDTVSGVCSDITHPLISGNSRIHITLSTGESFVLSIDRKHHFREGQTYLLYFKKGTPLDSGSQSWLQSALSDALLGYAEITDRDENSK